MDMEKPKKLDKFKDMDSRDKGYQVGYNNCIEDYEEFLPGEDELYKIIGEGYIFNKRTLAKTITKRIGKE